MDTRETYLGDDFYVRLAGETPPDRITEVMRRRHRERVEDDSSPLVGPEEFSAPEQPDEYMGVPVDGSVTFYDPALLEAGEAFKHYSFPFRDHSKGHKWFVEPNADKWNRHPIWKWTNPGADPHEALTLKPSLGVKSQEDDRVGFHCYLRSGEIQWL